MNKRITALAVTAASLPLAALAAAAPASATAPCDGVYPPGQAYHLNLSPTYLQVNKGATVTLGSRLIRGNYQCSGEKVGWWTRGRLDNPHVFHLSRTRPLTADYDIRGAGLVYQNYVPLDDFRYYTTYVQGFTLQAQSVGGLVQVFH